MPRPAAWHVPAAVLLGASLAVLGAGLDQPLFQALNALGAPPWDALWARWTVLGDGLTALALLLPWAVRRRDLAWAGLLAALLAGVAVPLLKGLLALPRPAAVLPPGSFHLIGPELRALAYPSGHTAAAFAVAGLLVLGRGWG
ncbi:MAG: phosphatase PAP2 family protein, partial [Gammaproteobacteria bacterium]